MPKGMRGGSNPGERRGGREKGTPNKRTVERDKATQVAVARLEEVLPNAFTGDAHALLMAVYKDTSLDLRVRIEAAKAAISFERPRLASTAMTTRSLDQISDDEFFRIWDGIAAFLAQHGRPLLTLDSDAGPDGGGSEESTARGSEADAPARAGELAQ